MNGNISARFFLLKTVDRLKRRDVHSFTTGVRTPSQLLLEEFKRRGARGGEAGSKKVKKVAWEI